MIISDLVDLTTASDPIGKTARRARFVATERIKTTDDTQLLKECNKSSEVLNDLFARPVYLNEAVKRGLIDKTEYREMI